MIISINSFLSLHNGDSCGHDHAVSFGSETFTVKTLADHVQIPDQNIVLVFVNGRRAEIDRHLADGDRVAFVPAVGGM
jgi:molybdopterin converting factor small subunit